MVDGARGKRFVVLSGEERIIYDQDISVVEDEMPVIDAGAPGMNKWKG